MSQKNGKCQKMIARLSCELVYGVNQGGAGDVRTPISVQNEQGVFILYRIG
jgi:hypothetical protein